MGVEVGTGQDRGLDFWREARTEMHPAARVARGGRCFGERDRPHLGDRHDADQAQVDDLELVRAGELVAVAPLVLVLEGLAQCRQCRAIERAVRQRHGQLEGLPAVTHVGEAAEGQRLAGKSRAHLGLQVGPDTFRRRHVDI